MLIHEIQTAVAHRFGTTVAEMLSDRQHQAVSRPRHVAMWLARHASGHTLPAIGMAFRRDHTTVLNAIRRVDARLEAEPELSHIVNALRNTVATEDYV